MRREASKLGLAEGGGGRAVPRAARGELAAAPWMEPIRRLVAHATREVQLLAALTPLEVKRERARLVGVLRSGDRAVPRWEYAPVGHDEVRRALDAAERLLVPESHGPLEALYLARVRELSVEAALCAAAGTGEVARLARERFAPLDGAVARAASALCAAWLGQPLPPPSEEEARPSDDADPRSLLSRMRAAVGRLRLPFAVVPHPPLAPLAATGDGVILVATGRLVADEDVERTVLHEIEGHARPRARALAAGLGLFRDGTARGIDDQEGRALLLEERAGMLGARRRRQLAARHGAVEAMLDGACFADVASMLVEAHGLDAEDAVLVAERAFRGGGGVRPGLGRERIYLEAFVRVRDHLAEHPEDEAVLEAGQVAVAAASTLRAFVAG